MSDEKVTYFGLWITNQGWIKGDKNDPISFTDYPFAREASHIIGAKVRRIDTSWKDLEIIYLESERKSLWHIFKNFFAHKKIS